MPSRVTDPRVFLAAFRRGRAAADPLRRVPAFLPLRPRGRTVVVGAGKAAARMAQAVERARCRDAEGLVITRYGHAVPCATIEVAEAVHPDHCATSTYGDT